MQRQFMIFNFLMHIRLFDVIFDYGKTNLQGIFFVLNRCKNTRTKLETCLKLKPKTKNTRTSLSNNILPNNTLVLAYMADDRWQMRILRVHFNNCCTSGHQQVRTHDKKNFCFYISLIKYSRNLIEKGYPKI